MSELSAQPILALAPSIYFVETLVQTDLRTAWKVLPDYRAWNPSFVGATVTVVKGDPNCVGGVVQICISQPNAVPDTLFPEYYAETIVSVPECRLIWFCYAKEGQRYQGQADPFRNFVDFELTQKGSDVKFQIRYYAQNRLAGDALNAERSRMQAGLGSVAEAFRKYCEQHGANL